MCSHSHWTMASFVRHRHGQLIFAPCKTGSTYLRYCGWDTGPWPDTEVLDQYRSYAVIRDPVSRLLSAIVMFMFKPEVLGSVPGDWTGNTLERLQAWYRDFGQDRWQDPRETIEHFVLHGLELVVNKREGGDPHFWPQHLEWTYSGVPTESISVFMPTPLLSQLAYVHLGVPRRPPANPMGSWLLPFSRRDAFTPAALDRIHEIYEEDFRIWNRYGVPQLSR